MEEKYLDYDVYTRGEEKYYVLVKEEGVHIVIDFEDNNFCPVESVDTFGALVKYLGNDNFSYETTERLYC